MQKARWRKQARGYLGALETLRPLVAAAAPRTTALLGVATGHAGQLLVAAGENIDRLSSEAAFAHLCAASPVPASSGKTIRHRLNLGGNRDANVDAHVNLPRPAH